MKKIEKKSEIKLIDLKKAVELSDGYFKTPASIKNAICRGAITRYGAPKRVEIDYYEFMKYLGRPA